MIINLIIKNKNSCPIFSFQKISQVFHFFFSFFFFLPFFPFCFHLFIFFIYFFSALRICDFGFAKKKGDKKEKKGEKEKNKTTTLKEQLLQQLTVDGEEKWEGEEEGGDKEKMVLKRVGGVKSLTELYGEEGGREKKEGREGRGKLENQRREERMTILGTQYYMVCLLLFVVYCLLFLLLLFLPVLMNHTKKMICMKIIIGSRNIRWHLQ